MIDKGASKVMECFGVKRGENVLIVVDTATPVAIGRSLFKAALDLGCEVILMTILPRTRHGEEPPAAVAEAMKSADVVLAPTTYSLTHTQAKINACKAGARVASMPGITEEMMTSGGMTADYNNIRDTAIRLSMRLENIREVRVTTESGTDIVFNLEGCRWMMDTGLCHEPGCSANLPAGELYIAPKDANGIFVVDGSMSGFGVLDSPLEFTVRNRYVVGIKGKHADKLNSILNRVGEKARNIAELGIGINPEARLIGNVLEDEKVGGTVHIALGDNSSFGGDVIAGIHLDGIIKKPSIFLDEEKFIFEL
ncbi:leucyl aminopeptidase (aminopeptidase T) [Candidatus Methanoperedens nitroreducens]|uniref:Leucyl aminopeptidase (Aminopeptidase T) n=1 Tax=Candidatus Methanoperedens nitratireducens TaxID=1392998 RepID=A0A062V3F9_9EURY|nr:aminopeptidase [Candidatus Methanoperedens nitroreducens]KCZ70354.1 leucyl aminopeptidase (aminopeptidase T) [Candidatus Methanoperedens nitroreducens]MDJ1420792.1 aminopeptidase [Candidatus Methanoperedens sp.]